MPHVIDTYTFTSMVEDRDYDAVYVIYYVPGEFARSYSVIYILKD